MIRKKPLFQARLTDAEIDLAHALRQVGCPEAPAGVSVAHPDTGAVVGFTGIVRALEQGRALRGIRYEAYRSMAMKEMNRILDEARDRWPLQAAVAIHRVGETPVGHPSVAVAVAAGHRDEAFRAARFLIDAVKERVPLWKNFAYVDAVKGAVRLPRFLLAVPLQTLPESSGGFVGRARRAGANAIELRADSLAGSQGLSPDAIRGLAEDLRRADSRVALILTPRARAEGGTAALSIARRKAIIEMCLSVVDAVDVELHSRSLAEWAAPRVEAAGKLLILSNHDFEKTPPMAELNRLVKEASPWPGAMLKIAATARNRGDLLRLAQWTIHNGDSRPLAAMSMGERGGAGRVLLAALGSRLAFACLGDASAPGQIEASLFARAVRRLRRQMKTASPPASKADLDGLLKKAEFLVAAAQGSSKG